MGGFANQKGEKMKIKGGIITLGMLVILSFWGVSPTQGLENISLGECFDLTITGYLKNETYIRAWHGPDDIMSSRNVFNLDLDASFPGIPILRRGFIKLRPFYDTVFDWENEGTGGGSSKLRRHFQDNFGVADDWDPLLRECWVDLSLGNLDARLGRQLVSWGKSDGIYMLDLINPFNWRNGCVFEEEDTKIPLWMANFNYHVTSTQILQFLFIPRYVPAHNAFDGHDWTSNVTRWVNDYYEYFDDYFQYMGWGRFGVDIKEPATTFSNSEYGVRWSGMAKGLTYTLNYFYTWSDYLTDYPNTGDWYTAYEVKRRADRLSIFGGSADYCWDSFLGLKQMVTRGEVAYFKNAVWYDYDFYPKEKDYIGVLLGFDKYYFVDYWFSLQFQATYIPHADHWNGAYYDLGSGYKGQPHTEDVLNGYGTGMRDSLETALTFYLMKEYLPGDILHTEWFVLYDDDGAVWFRPKVKYDVTNQFHVTLGANLFWGNEDDPFVGESHNNDNVFLEFLWGF